jgi:hypothetical protein
MEIENLVRYKGKVYRLVFAKTDSALSDEDRTDICIDAIMMRDKGRKTQKIKGDNYEGRMKFEGIQVLGSFSGEVYSARIETDHGERDLSLMINN